MSPDQTFSSTLTGIERLRSQHRDAEDTGNFKEYRYHIIDSLKELAEGCHDMAKELNGLKLEMKDFASAQVMTDVLLRLDRIEQSRNGSARMWRALWALALVIIGALASRQFK